eukprot:TRINITY_DN19682_c1_g1_i2.p1 TRINITY_DN19682_c1_g1~~TRINITY_DN19682_c1_g1_i2.p1  ORF type:complete len:148 (-),score=16.94 TRINITY_DN19682_c1_g1_i2:410-853(-)
MAGIVMPVVLAGLFVGLVHTQILTCGGSGAFTAFVAVFERESAQFVGYTPVCSEGTLNIGNDKNVPNHFPYQVQWFGQQWTVNSNDKYELKQGNKTLKLISKFGNQYVIMNFSKLSKGGGSEGFFGMVQRGWKRHFGDQSSLLSVNC